MLDFWALGEWWAKRMDILKLSFVAEKAASN